MPHQVPLPLPWPGVSVIVIHILLHIKSFANDSFPIQTPFDNADSDMEVGLLASELSLPRPDSKTERAAPSPYLLKSREGADSGQTASVHIKFCSSHLCLRCLYVEEEGRGEKSLLVDPPGGISCSPPAPQTLKESDQILAIRQLQGLSKPLFFPSVESELLVLCLVNSHAIQQSIKQHRISARGSSFNPNYPSEELLV